MMSCKASFNLMIETIFIFHIYTHRFISLGDEAGLVQTIHALLELALQLHVMLSGCEIINALYQDERKPCMCVCVCIFYFILL